MRDDHFWALFGIAWVFGWALVWLLHHYLRERTRLRLREMAHRERLVALERQVPLPELPDLDEAREISPWIDLKAQPVLLARLALGLGLLALFVGIGICLGFWISGDPGQRAAWSLGLIPAMGGVGLLLYCVLLSRSAGGGR